MLSPRAFVSRFGPFRALRHRDFAVLLGGMTLVGFVMPMQFLTQIFWIQDEYPGREVLYVALLAGVRGSAMLTFSLLGGAIADRFERRRVLLACEIMALCLNALVALLMLTNPFGGAGVIALFVITFFAAGNMAIDMPTRSASIPAVVGMKDLSAAIALNMIAMQGGFLFAPPLVGVLNEAFSAGQVYAGTLLTWAVIIPLIATLKYRSRGEANRSVGMLTNIKEGLAYTRRDQTLFAVILLVLVMQTLGMPGVATLGPVWMREVMNLSKSGFGAMAFTWGLGGACASLLFVLRHRLAQRGTTLVAVTTIFAIGVIVFGHSRFIPLTAVANFALGFCMVSTNTTSSTIAQHVVSEEMRGRVMGLFPLMMGLSMLTAAPVGSVGQVIGLEAVVPTLGWITLALVLTIIALRPQLRRIDGATVRAPEPAPTPIVSPSPAKSGEGAGG
ncbi:MAG TPA: MFS transporter [Tepidiformaceae bacterium]|nr:MFS transporter [Tepidiformaceae bacterium]